MWQVFSDHITNVFNIDTECTSFFKNINQFFSFQGTQVQQTQLRTSAEMTVLVDQINTFNFDSSVEEKNQDAANGLLSAEQTRNTSHEAR